MKRSIKTKQITSVVVALMVVAFICVPLFAIADSEKGGESPALFAFDVQEGSEDLLGEGQDGSDAASSAPGNPDGSDEAADFEQENVGDSGEFGAGGQDAENPDGESGENAGEHGDPATPLSDEGENGEKVEPLAEPATYAIVLNNCSDLLFIRSDSYAGGYATSITDMDGTTYSADFVYANIEAAIAENKGEPYWSGDTSITSVAVKSGQGVSLSDCHNLFANLPNLSSVNLTGLDVSGASNFGEMFRDCFSLTSVDLSSLNTVSGTNFANLFDGCEGLQTVSLAGGFTTAGATESEGQLDNMFQGCTNLRSITLGAGVTQMSGLLANTPLGSGWWSNSDGKSYTPAQISARLGTADTYTKARPIQFATVSGVDARYDYTGEAIMPEPVVKSVDADGVNELTLIKGTDYTVSYSNNTSAGTATITITGTERYELGVVGFVGTKEITFEIAEVDTRLDIADAEVADIEPQYRTGSAITPEPVVTYEGATLTKGTDYTLSYESNTEIGTATITITGAGNYKGETTATFKIVGNLQQATLSAIADQTWTGSAITPDFTVTYNSTTLTKGTDYTVEYSNNTDPGTATATITGTGNYGNTNSATFNIRKDISAAAVEAIADQTYTGNAIEPALNVTFGGTELSKGTDYTVAFSNNTDIGTADITLTGTGNYKGTKSATFKIKGDVAGAEVTGLSETYDRTGSAIVPEVTVTYAGATLTKGTDYTVECANNTEPGTATMTISGAGEHYLGTKTAQFKIVGSLADATVSGVSSTYEHTGSAITPTPTVTCYGKTLSAGTDYTVTYSNNTNLGVGTVEVVGTGDYTGTKPTTFTIFAYISNAMISAISNQMYTGAYLEPPITVTYDGQVLTAGTGHDYTFGYSSNRNPGTATVTVYGEGDYFKGQTSATFKIVVDDTQADATTGISLKSGAYEAYSRDGNTVALKVEQITNETTISNMKSRLTAKDAPFWAYDLSLVVNKAGAGTERIVELLDSHAATVKIPLGATYANQQLNVNGLYKGTDGSEEDIRYGALTADADGVITLTNVTKLSSVVIYEKDNSTPPDPIDISGATISDMANQLYTGSAIEPLFSVKIGTTTLAAGTDYDFAFTDNVNPGTATLTVTGKNDYTGTATATFAIYVLDTQTDGDLSFTAKDDAYEAYFKDGDKVVLKVRDITEDDDMTAHSRIAELKARYGAYDSPFWLYDASLELWKHTGGVELITEDFGTATVKIRLGEDQAGKAYYVHELHKTDDGAEEDIAFGKLTADDQGAITLTVTKMSEFVVYDKAETPEPGPNPNPDDGGDDVKKDPSKPAEPKTSTIRSNPSDMPPAGDPLGSLAMVLAFTAVVAFAAGAFALRRRELAQLRSKLLLLISNR